MSVKTTYTFLGHTYCMRQGACPVNLNGLCNKIGPRVIGRIEIVTEGDQESVQRRVDLQIGEWRRLGFESVCEELVRLLPAGEGEGVRVYRSRGFKIVSGSQERRG